jgi:2-oxoglutarate dehydrogenase E1 component
VVTPEELEELLEAMAAARGLVQAHRTHGHLAAHLDPLGAEPPGDPSLDPLESIPPLTPALQARLPAKALGVYVPGDTLVDVLPHLKETYCQTMAFEIEHIADHSQRAWLREMIESGRYRTPLDPAESHLLLTRLAEVEGLERYLRRAFLGQKQFSLEGVDVIVPMLDTLIEAAARHGGRDIVIGMAHRGRLNVLAHVVGMPYDHILREFEGERKITAVVTDPEGGSGDVKYHLGAQGTRETDAGAVRVVLAANPSHLEAVDPVVCGLARALQSERQERELQQDPLFALPVLIHGDASFAGQGVVAETLNLADLPGYSVGGVIHLIANNQVGFTTDPAEGRSTYYASDLAKGFDLPVVHVNADDPEAALAAARLAADWRQRFGRDFVIDVVGYRRHGHNEQDEPAYTQPLMYERVVKHESVRALYARTLGEADAGEALVTAAEARLKAAHETLKQALEAPLEAVEDRHPHSRPPQTAVAAPRLRQLNDSLFALTDSFAVNAKLVKQLERRRSLAPGTIDWGHAEALAFATLLADGVPVRLSGQDTERGTFSHRHAVLHDAAGAKLTPLALLPESQAAFELHNSPLSEYACVGFEYGYATGAPETLVLWEAQFGDFVNGTQIIIDQFLVAGLSKWRQTARLTLLLPHGYEGNGPEHSSARLERFLQLAAQGNIRVVVPTTAAQYFHLLRRQALELATRPLIVMTPKGLLKFKASMSSLADLTAGGFAEVIDDQTVSPEGVRRLVLCAGKVYYDIEGHARRAEASDIAVARVEQLYPFPSGAAKELVARYPNLQELVWAQEEPQNMGAWRTIRHRLEELTDRPVSYAGRPWRASPAEGYPTAHLLEQERIVLAALGLPA